MQLVHLVRSGERAQMSKRAGEFVTLDELVAEIGVDAARWYLLARSHDTTVDLDLDLAREPVERRTRSTTCSTRTRGSPRCSSKAGERARRAARVDGSRLPTPAGEPLHASERALIEQLLAFPVELAEAVARRAPHRIAAYALELAQGFTAFYRDCRVRRRRARARSSRGGSRCASASKRTIARCLDLLGVSAPEHM